MAATAAGNRFSGYSGCSLKSAQKSQAFVEETLSSGVRGVSVFQARDTDLTLVALGGASPPWPSLGGPVRRGSPTVPGAGGKDHALMVNR
jgi:hypothetical protein